MARSTKINNVLHLCSWIFINIFSSKEDIFSFSRSSIKFCTCEVIFVMLAKLMCKLLQHIVYKHIVFVCRHGSFCWPGHVCSYYMFGNSGYQILTVALIWWFGRLLLNYQIKICQHLYKYRSIIVLMLVNHQFNLLKFLSNIISSKYYCLYWSPAVTVSWH